jgi:hypothetical protein
MNKVTVCFAAAALTLGFATAAFAQEYNKADATSVAMGKPKRTDCSVKEEIQGKTYCFEHDASKAEFMKDTAGNIAKADAYWSPCASDKETSYMYCE